MKFNWKLFAAVSTLTGTIIGAGFLGIPYVVAQSGFIIGFLQIIILGIMMLIAKLYLGEIMLRTKKIHQLPGLAKLYLGKFGEKILYFAMFFGIYSALIAYLIAEGESLSYIFSGSLNYSLYLAIIFWIFCSLLVYRGLNELRKWESIGMIFIFVILLFILAYFLKDIQLENLLTYNLGNAFLPFGIIVFALLGFSSIPEVLMELKGNEKLLKKSIIFGAIVPIVIYCFFTFVVVGLAGKTTPEIATFAMINFGFGKIFVLLGILTIFTSYLTLSFAMKDMYRFDLKLNKKKSFLLSSIFPLIIFLIVYLFDLASFTDVLSLSGVVTGGIISISVLLMFKKARKLGKRKPEYTVKLPHWIIILLILIFIIGMLLQLFF